jgi:hypothetical protein
LWATGTFVSPINDAVVSDTWSTFCYTHNEWSRVKVKYTIYNLMFVPCIIRRSINNQRYTQICTTALFYTLAPTYFGSSLPSSGSFWIRLSYMKMQVDLVVNHIMWLSGLFVGVSWFRLLCFPARWKAQQSLDIEKSSGANLCIALVISTA